ncbi:MAG: hypothetical protein ACI4WS_03095 [Oscillospiraceae bacterium]
MYKKNVSLKLPQNAKKKNRDNLLNVFAATNVIIYICYAIVACVVSIIQTDLSILFGFIFGTIPLILLTMLPYYFAKVFVDVAEDIHTLAEKAPPVEINAEQDKPENNISAGNEE